MGQECSLSTASAAEIPLRVLLTTDTVGGVWDFCWMLASELDRFGHAVTLLAFGEPTTTQRRQANRAGATLRNAPLKLEWMAKSARDLRHARKLVVEVEREVLPDVIHVNQYGVLSGDLIAPTVLTAHSDVLSWRKWNCQPLDLDDDLQHYRAIVRGGMQAADGVVAVSRFVASEMAALYGIRREITVIHNGWRSSPLSPRPVEERPRQTLLAGRVWDSAKNVGLAARAAVGWNPGRVLLAGDQRHPESGGLADPGVPIEPIGFQPREQIDRLLDESRLFLAPARYEPFGLLPLQAALAGCPLLLSDIPSFRELWTGAALFFRSDDPDDLRLQWRRLLDDDALATDLARRARLRCWEQYSATRCTEQYLALYRRLRRPVPGADYAASWAVA